MSDWKALNGGVPQGTKLGVILFSVMANRLLSDWKLPIKFVDDTSAIEILPRNSISLLSSAATDIHRFTIDHNMRLNPPKCKEMLTNFMHYSNFSLSPIIIGKKVIKRVSTYKILGVHVDRDLNPIQSKGGGGGADSKGFFIITFEQFRIQSSNCTTFPKILLAIFLNVFQHYPRSHVAIVTDNLEGAYSIFEFFIF